MSTTVNDKFYITLFPDIINTFYVNGKKDLEDTICPFARMLYGTKMRSNYG